uniref:Neurotransmitter-gated ion-channel ligand-binding domain-containing protein n=1 Tax=Meloidogyne javanica TaxID=6303 RepID=A0A915N420_MELJA
MTTNVWLQHIWTDSKLCWNPKDYGGVEVLYVPSELIWLPDIVLYNNADGNYQVTIMNKAKLSYNGTVEWTPPAIYKSMCQIDVEWFPFDAQTCEMKFGSWTYGGLEVDLKHKNEQMQHEEQELTVGPDGENQWETVWVVDDGIDLNDYYPSVEWDILRVPGKRHQKKYPCCISPFIDLTYEIHLRRKTLFYTLHLLPNAVLRKQKEREALSQRRLTLQRQSILEQMEIHTAPSSAEAIKRIAGHGRESSGLIAHFASTSREREQNGSLYREQSPLKSAVDSLFDHPLHVENVQQ